MARKVPLLMGKHASGGEDPSPFLEVHGGSIPQEERRNGRTDGHAMINGAALNFHPDDAVQS